MLNVTLPIFLFLGECGRVLLELLSRLVGRGGRRGRGGRDVGTEESKFRLCRLVVQSATSCSYAVEDGLPDGGEVSSVLTARYRSCCAHVDFNISVGINERDCARRVVDKLKANAVAIKILIGFEKKGPRTVPDEVGHKAAEDPSTSRATWKANKKSGCYWRGHSILLKLGF